MGALPPSTSVPWSLSEVCSVSTARRGLGRWCPSQRNTSRTWPSAVARMDRYLSTDPQQTHHHVMTNNRFGANDRRVKQKPPFSSKDYFLVYYKMTAKVVVGCCSVAEDKEVSSLEAQLPPYDPSTHQVSLHGSYQPERHGW